MLLKYRMSIISVQNLTKKFGNFEALKGISFELEEGEVFGLLGPNGAGKTTTLSILYTMLAPTSGKATVNGFDVIQHPHDVRKSIGVVFQDPSLDLDLTARENLQLHARLYHLPKNEIKDRIKWALEIVDLSEHADREVKKYSGGMKRRLEIARSLMHTPKILFLDEPTLGLDPQTRRKLWEYISKLNKEKKLTIILTTHYMDEADELCQRIAIVDKGKIVAMDSSTNLKKQMKGDTIDIESSNNSFFTQKTIPFAKEIKLHDGHVTITVENAEKSLSEVVLIAKQNKVDVHNIQMHKPSLEDVFLHFTGHTLRESELGAGDQFVERARMMQGARR